MMIEGNGVMKNMRRSVTTAAVPLIPSSGPAAVICHTTATVVHPKASLPPTNTPKTGRPQTRKARALVLAAQLQLRHHQRQRLDRLRDNVDGGGALLLQLQAVFERQDVGVAQLRGWGGAGALCQGGGQQTGGLGVPYRTALLLQCLLLQCRCCSRMVLTPRCCSLTSK